MALQAFLDDSGGTTGPTFVLAGFISSLEKWERFSDAWADALAEAPSIQYYKNSQAMSRKDQFDGWSYLDVQNKISKLVKIITQHVIYKISVSIDHDEFNKFMTTNDIEVLRDPYYILFLSVISMVIIALSQQDEKHPVSFVFDEQGAVGVRAIEMVLELQKNSQMHFTKSEAELLAGLPTFANDKKVAAIQAADLYAGNVRRFYIDNRKLYMPLRQTMRDLKSIPSFAKTLNARELSISAAHYLSHFLPLRDDD